MRISCLLLGHTTYHLDAAHPAHCHRCGRPDEAWLASMRVLEQVREALLGEAAEVCAWCKEPARGLASIGTRRYCHRGADPTCYQRAQWADSFSRVVDIDFDERTDLTPVVLEPAPEDDW